MRAIVRRAFLVVLVGTLGTIVNGCASNPQSACPQSLRIAVLLRPAPGSTTSASQLSTLEFGANVAVGSSYQVDLIPSTGASISLIEIATPDADGTGSDIAVPTSVFVAPQMTYTVRLAASNPPPCGGPFLLPPQNTFRTQ